MLRHLSSALWLLMFTLILCCVLYPFALWAVGRTVFRHQAEGSLVDENGNPVTDVQKARGSVLIGQPFKGDEYFQPRPSNAGNGYDASASGASNWSASNPLLRSRVARQLGPLVKYAGTSPTRPGQLVGSDVEAWFQKQKPTFVGQWAEDNSTLSEQWVKDNADAVAGWLKKSVDDVKADSSAAAKAFWKSYATTHPGTWPKVEDKTIKDDSGKDQIIKVITPVKEGDDVQSNFFDLWLQDQHVAIAQKKIILEQVPADLVMSSGSGLDPHITLKNAHWQLKNRVAEKQAQKILERNPEVAPLVEAVARQPDETRRKPIEARLQAAKARVRRKMETVLGKPLDEKISEAIKAILRSKKEAPLGGLAGVDLVNVLEVNVALTARMAELARELQ